MLAEHFVASIQSPLKTTAAGAKDVCIFVNELQPLSGTRQSFKRSATAPNCLAVSDSHVFAAQAEKAVVHVYNREKGNHEATIPFNEKITCLALDISGFVLLLGTEGGRILAWELATGRLVSTPQSHLQAVTCLAVDPTANFLLSGSRDSNVLVWSLSGIMSFSSSENTRPISLSPVHSLSSQRGCITSLCIGHGHGQANIAVSASEDQSVVVWNYQKGVGLRTYLLRAIPRALVLDKSDRGFYTTYDDGSIQLIDFNLEGEHVDQLYDENFTAPVQPGDNFLFKAEGQELQEGLSLSLSWDGSRLLSGHKSGKIAAWDVGKGSFLSVVETLPGTATNVIVTSPRNLPRNTGHAVQLMEIAKPRISNLEAGGVVPGDYTLAAQLAPGPYPCHVGSSGSPGQANRSRFADILSHGSVPSNLLGGAIAELSGGNTSSKITSNGSSVQNEDTRRELETIKVQNENFQRQIEHLQKLQKASFAQLREKNQAMSVLVLEKEHLAEIAKAEHGWDITNANNEWTKYQQGKKTGKVVNGKSRDGDQEMVDEG